MTAPARGKKGMQIPLRTALVLGSAGLMLLAVAIALILGYRGARETTADLLSRRADAIIEDMADGIALKLDSVLDQATWIAEAFATGRIDFDNTDRLDAFMGGTLAATPQLTGLALYSADFRRRLFLRNGTGVNVSDRSSEPGIRQLLAEIRRGRGSSWGAPIWVDEVGETIINLRTPLLRNDQFVGALIQGVSITDLSRTLSAAANRNGFIQFVLYDRKWVLAHPFLVDRRVPFSDAQPLPALAAFEDQLLQNIWSGQRRPFEYIRPKSSIRGGTVDVGAHAYSFLYRELDRYADAPLTLGVYFDAALVDETEQVKRLRRLFYVGFGVLMLSVVAALLGGQAIAKPVLRLSDAARRIKSGELEQFQPLPRTVFREITDASMSFNAMVEGLKERNLVRGLLGKYIPEDVAKNLIKDRGAIAPVVTEATVMFTDIGGFTTIAEALAPERTVAMLNEYFTVLASILEDHGGVIAQFQGDGLLAMFNVPIADSDHAAQAIRSALAIQEALRERLFAGRALSCRIGLATGEVMAGSVGARDRLTFTVYGDTVNLASRLEQMNKRFGTRILMHRRTAELAGDLPLESMGDVHVRGRAGPVTVFTVGAGKR
jgi:class 3 adenylate cyclase